MGRASVADLTLQWQVRLRHWSGPVAGFAGVQPCGHVGDNIIMGQLSTPQCGTPQCDHLQPKQKHQPGDKEDLQQWQQSVQQPWSQTCWEHWAAENFSASSTSSDCSSVALPMQDGWGELPFQPETPLAATPPPPWQPHQQLGAQPCMLDQSATWQPETAALGAAVSPFMAYSCASPGTRQLPALSGEHRMSPLLSSSDGSCAEAAGTPVGKEKAAQAPRGRKADATRGEKRARRRRQQQMAQQRYRERQRAWMTEVEDKMAILSTECRETKAANVELVKRRNAMQAAVIAMEAAIASRDAEAAAIRERLIGRADAQPPPDATADAIDVQRQVEPTQAFRQQQIAQALSLTPLQVQTLLRVRTRQLMRLRDLESAGAVLGMQVMSHMLPALQATSAAPPARLDDVLAGHDLPALVGIVDLYADVQQLQANSAEARRAVTALDEVVVHHVLTPLQRAVLVVESAPANPDTLALLDTLAGMHDGNVPVWITA